MTQSPPCPYCQNTSYRRVGQQRLVCTACEHEFDIEHNLCRACGHLNKDGVARCAHCQAELNPDTIGRIIGDRTKPRERWQKERLKIAREQRKREAQIAEKQMAEYWAEEEARRQALARRLAEKQERDRRMMIAVGIVAAVVLALILIITVVVHLAA